ncbi:MAG TPA: AAA family ATPase, partial [Steroidobacteraceae bacterium]|nr:AAA family ATPase [Steroidobacteraceae bacterium]
ELRLNRRFAPELYVDVCAISTAADGLACVSGAGDEDEPSEYAVKMHQFCRDDELDNLLAAGHIEPAELAAFGTALARIHQQLPVARPPAKWGDPDAVCAAIWRNFSECEQASAVFSTGASVNALRPGLARCLEAAAPWMAERREAGRVRECHGDLHAGNLVRLSSRLVAFDCLEFEPAFRWIDVADEIAFLAMDLEAQARPQHSQAFLSAYLSQGGDYQAGRVLRAYTAHRALVRAKVQALNVTTSQAPDEHERARARYLSYLTCAGKVLAADGTLLLMSGLSGSGKTWLASRLAPRLGAVHIRSDLERKRLVELEPDARTQSGLGAGLYSGEMSARVYTHLVEAAAHILAGGRSVIVDATFARREHRTLFEDLAVRLGVSACLIHCQAPAEVLIARVRARHDERKDASEADPAVLGWQRERWEPLGGPERWNTVDVDTTAPDLEDVLRRIDRCRRI